MRPDLRADNYAALVVPHVKVRMETFITCYGKDIRLSYCHILNLFLYARQGLGLRLSSVSIKVGVNKKRFLCKNIRRKYK
jgi:hypothetical protein